MTPKHGGFRVSPKIRKKIEQRKRRIARRLDKQDNRGCDQPIMTASNIHYEIADRTRATAAGGIGAMHLLVRKLGLDEAINRSLGLLKIHLPYHDSDHVLNIAYNLLAGGNVPGAPGTAPPQRSLPRRLGRPPHPRSHHGGRLLPPFRHVPHLLPAGSVQRHAAEGLAAAAQVVLRRGHH